MREKNIDIEIRPDNARVSNLSIFLTRQESKFPRLFNLILYVVLPLFFLVCWPIFCGHFLAVLERTSELKANDAIFENRANEAMRLDSLIVIVQRGYDDCFEQYQQKSSSAFVNITELKSFMQDCTSLEVQRSHEIKEEIKKDLDEFYTAQTSFSWNTCAKNETMLSHAEQSSFAYDHWNASFHQLQETYLNIDGESDKEESIRLAMGNATASDSCILNSLGGSFFWFTIMTTIGYGNTAPVTPQGMTLVIILGFVSILAFATFSVAAGNVITTISDDFLRRVKLKRMTKGWTSVIFWLITFVLAVLLLAEVTRLYNNKLVNNESDGLWTFKERCWFSFISLTTVGLGDYHINHEAFSLSDMFYLPPILLLGFICVANFLDKFSQAVAVTWENIKITNESTLADILHTRHIRCLTVSGKKPKSEDSVYARSMSVYDNVSSKDVLADEDESIVDFASCKP